MGMGSEVCMLFMLLVMFVGAVCSGAHRARGMREGAWRRGSCSGILETDRGNGRGLGEVRHLLGLPAVKERSGEVIQRSIFWTVSKKGRVISGEVAGLDSVRHVGLWQCVS